MRPLVLRGEDPPDDTVVVIRGGEMENVFVRRSAERNHEEFGFFGISVFAAEDRTVEDLCAHLPQLARYRRVRLSTAGRLRACGFALVATMARPHVDVVLPDASDATLERLDGCFDPPIDNPGRR